jgi:hypothetical protein
VTRVVLSGVLGFAIGWMCCFLDGVIASKSNGRPKTADELA